MTPRDDASVYTQAAGFCVREAADGDEGVQAYRREPTDLVLCDLGTIIDLRRAYPHVRVVALAGGASPWVRQSLRVTATLSIPGRRWFAA